MGTRVRGVSRVVRWVVVLCSTGLVLGSGAAITDRASRPAGSAGDVLSSYDIAAPAAAALGLTATPPLWYHGPAPLPAPEAPAATSSPVTSSSPVTQASSAAPAPARSTTAAPTSAPPAPTGGRALPLSPPVGGSTQVVTVVAASSRATTAKLTAWELGAGVWTPVLGPVGARIGAAGVGAAGETISRTPAGTFPLPEAFGRRGDPGTALPYRVIDDQDWWVSDVGSPLYNEHTRCAAEACPFDVSAGENLWAEGAVYNYAVVIGYNRGGTPGAGSAFFLHVANSAPTAGCVAIDQGSLTTLMRWLDPAARPLIAIGVG